MLADSDVARGRKVACCGWSTVVVAVPSAAAGVGLGATLALGDLALAGVDFDRVRSKLNDGLRAVDWDRFISSDSRDVASHALQPFQNCAPAPLTQ